MEVKIGVQHATRELVLDIEQDQDTIEKQIAEAVADGSVLTLTDTKGRSTLVPGEKIAYVEIGTGVAGHVGFRS